MDRKDFLIFLSENEENTLEILDEFKEVLLNEIFLVKDYCLSVEEIIERNILLKKVDEISDRLSPLSMSFFRLDIEFESGRNDIIRRSCTGSKKDMK